MNHRPPTPATPTSLLLVLFTLIVGIALGWLLHDLVGILQPFAFGPNATTIAVSPTLRPPVAATTSPIPPATPETNPETAVPQPPTHEPPLPTAALPPPTPNPTPLPTLEPTNLPTSESIIGYSGHLVAPGETLTTIAANGGSTPALIMQYNRLNEPPLPGRALIVPQLAGQTNVLDTPPLLVRRGRNDKPWVALTLDAGANADPVPRMLQTLREQHVTLTFFLTGTWIKTNPELTRQIVADGHEIANHSFSHADMTHLDDHTIRDELADTEAIAQTVAATSSRPFFRPPYGSTNERLLRLVAQEGYLPILWTLDSLDSVGEPKTPAFLVDRITASLPAEQLRGAIILAHCGNASTADALPQILARFATQGFEVRKLSDVLGP